MIVAAKDTPSSNNRAWVQLQGRLQSCSRGDDDPYVCLAVEVISAAAHAYAEGPASSRFEEVAFLLDVKSPYHQMLDLSEDDIDALLTRLRKEPLCKTGYRNRRRKSTAGRKRLSVAHVQSRSSLASTSGATSSTPSA